MAALVANALFDKATAFVRGPDGVLEVDPSCLTETLLSAASPWRTFRSYKGKMHYSGSYYSITDGGAIIYESRLELARAMLADFSPEVRRICAQPCSLRTRVDGRLTRHTPDFIFFGTKGLTLCVVKPASLLDEPKIAATIAWVRGIAEDTGWGFEVFSEPDPVVLGNVRFFAGYRRPGGIRPLLLTELRSRKLAGRTFGGAVRAVDAPPPCARAALLHLLWRQELRIDLRRPLRYSTVLLAGARS
ncbi:TnsA-like heteromeric transposase endonuclease subunit [Candidatus Mycobacterium wuenschmannii]|uniref:TnsA-like heteromeric transposase endonuclease subunit n=1 Tax=Candidatus Mycobacterium wuenschmannii TaxID=3027808 RepID=A0ABY8W1N5_9MYCO|nr:TnsA-like heteromeric transposase endonuclease subunit [Candidatus Mycobacterium wuenschmannii]WIM89758.1 TnsA-like heteromeric transposase endonuclease subunit [Candidatus Mycobacterium wuenschmannii]